MVIGSGDRALDGKACVPWTRASSTLAPRVIPIQNRMRLTQSPGRAEPKRGYKAQRCCKAQKACARSTAQTSLWRV